MQQELLIALFAGIGGMLGWGFADFFAKITIDKVGSIVSLVWAHIFGTTLFIFLALLQFLIVGKGVVIPTEVGTWGLLFLFGTLQAIVYLFAYIGFGKGQLAVLNPIFASYSGLAAILSIVVFGELISNQLLFALAIIFSGVLFLNIDLKALRSKRLSFSRIPGVKEVALASLLAAFWTVFWDKVVGGQDWVSYALYMYAFMTLAAFAIAKFMKVKLLPIKPEVWKFMVLIGFCETIAYLAISLGFSTTPFTSIVAVLSGAFSLPTIILARLFLKEKVATIQTIGTFVIIVGIIVLSLQ